MWTQQHPCCGFKPEGWQEQINHSGIVPGKVPGPKNKTCHVEPLVLPVIHLTILQQQPFLHFPPFSTTFEMNLFKYSTHVKITGRVLLEGMISDPADVDIILDALWKNILLWFPRSGRLQLSIWKYPGSSSESSENIHTSLQLCNLEGRYFQEFMGIQRREPRIWEIC